MATLRELKGRIGSVASSEKITGAMKMISSAKMHKAEQQLKRLQPYRNMVEGIMGTLLDSDAEFSSPLTEVREVATRAIVVLGSDDGLCGAYNVNVYKALMEQVGTLLGRGEKLVLIPVGSKMKKIVGKLQMNGVTVEAAPAGIDSKSDGDRVKEFLRTLTAGFTGGSYDAVSIMSMRFLSISRQRPRFEQLLPLDASTMREDGVAPQFKPCLFEPSANQIFVQVIPMFLLAVMTEAFVENRASEQAARVMAMQSANDNAKKLLEDLQLEYNKLRQQSITTELLDIVGGQVR